MSAIAQKRAQLTKLLGELEAGQKEMDAGPLTQTRGDELEAKAKEAEAIQSEIDQYDRIATLAAKRREVTDPALPAESKGANDPDAEVVGFMTLGKAFTHSREFKAYLDAGAPLHTGSALYQVKGLREPLVPVTKAQVKATPTIGADVIPQQRVADVVRSTEQRMLRIEDIMADERTSSNAVEYLTFTPATPAAGFVAQGALKPETGMTLGTATAPVRTLAVWLPVTEQQLQDIPQIQGMIDNELLFQLGFVKERQIVWGGGTGEDFLGIFNTPGVDAGRAVAGDTLLDRIRRAITDVRVAELMPNGVVLHPYDSEVLDLLKGSDSHYVWAVVTDNNGAQRVWGLNKVESQAMQKPTLSGANTVYERRVLVGDFVRGASLWQRQDAGVAVGYVNDDFIRNKRTIRAEERAAFGVKRPLAFRFVISQAEAA